VARTAYDLLALWARLVALPYLRGRRPRKALHAPTAEP
jgi:hypothetical protein